MKLNNKFILGSLMGAALMTTSCDDFLDRAPLTDITPELYFSSANDLAAYTINYYPTLLLNVNGSQLYATTSWNAGVVSHSDHLSDNQASGTGNTQYFGDASHWTVGTGRSLYNTYNRIRICNWFFDQVLPKYENGTLSGAEAEHYIGEMYFLRAMTYFNGVVQYGDLPIITEALPDDAAVLEEKSVRAPRNQVVRFILEDLDKAISLMKDKSFKNGQRLNKESALLFKSRVALFEGTFEKYHKGSGRVPGDSNWPGGSFSGNIDEEIKFFLQEAMEASKQVADNNALAVNSGVLNPASGVIYGWNEYFEMFSMPDPSSVSEVLFWRGYDKSQNISHSTVQRAKVGNNLGFTRSLVRSFLMKNGLPWYAEGSGFQGDSNLMKETADRDERLQLFMWRDDHKVYNDGASEIKDFGFTTLLSTDVEKRMITGYATRKGYCYDPNQQYSDDILSTNASVIFRSSEAYLNYIEACYELNNSLDGTAQSYWKALRKRAGVSEDFQKTIDATDLTKETEDWGLYSGAGKVDETLFNIRRERRNEFMGEDKRFADMLRWRSFDHLMTQEVHVYGFNFWEEQYKAYEEEFGTVIADGSADAVLSSPELGNYILPYRRTDLNNEFVNGLQWHEAYYLYPLGVQDMQLAPQLYQNVNWPTEGGTTALK